MQGWWEGTFQALGVGSIVGGLVDVLAISALNQVQQRQDLKIRLVGILDSEPFSVEDAQALLKTDRGQLDRHMVAMLESSIERGLRDAEERKRYEDEHP